MLVQQVAAGLILNGYIACQEPWDELFYHYAASQSSGRTRRFVRVGIFGILIHHSHSFLEQRFKYELPQVIPLQLYTTCYTWRKISKQPTLSITLFPTSSLGDTLY